MYLNISYDKWKIEKLVKYVGFHEEYVHVALTD
jgi:hypothetical protein